MTVLRDGSQLRVARVLPAHDLILTGFAFPSTHGCEPFTYLPRSLNTGELMKSSNEIRPFFDAALRMHPKQSHTRAGLLAGLMARMTYDGRVAGLRLL